MNDQHGASAVPSAQPLLTISAVARRLELSVSTVRRLVRRGELQRVRVGRSVRFREADLARLIDGETTSTQKVHDPAGGPGRAKAAGGGGRHGSA